MSVEFVTVTHPDIEGEARVPVRSLAGYEEGGWSAVKGSESTNSSLPHAPASAGNSEKPSSEKKSTRKTSD